MLIAFGTLSVILLFYSANGLLETQLKHKEPQNTAQPIKIEAKKIVRNLPVRLKIPGINIDAAVVNVGATSTGAMDIPSSTSDVGWYDLGPSPGEQGSAVFDGHFNGGNGRDGVFKDLEKLKEGDRIDVTNDQGKIISFAVREIRIYRPGYAEEVFSSGDSGIHLNLITCDGNWDKAQKSYTKRLVVFADAI